MAFRFYILLVMFGLCQNTIYCVPCNCGLGKGVNVCSKGENPHDTTCYPLVVRPQTLSKVDVSTLSQPGSIVYEKIETPGNNVAPLKPIGDLCSCGKTIVKPAHVPKPACHSCGAPYDAGSEGDTSLYSHGHDHHSERSGPSPYSPEPYPHSHGSHVDSKEYRHSLHSHGSDADSRGYRHSLYSHGSDADSRGYRHSSYSHGFDADSKGYRYSPHSHGPDADSKRYRPSPYSHGPDSDSKGYIISSHSPGDSSYAPGFSSYHRLQDEKSEGFSHHDSRTTYLHNTHSGSTFGHHIGEGTVIDYPICGLPVIHAPKVHHHDSGVPADAISKALVRNELHKKEIAVDHLQFGTRKRPIELPSTYVDKTKSVIPEHSYFKHNGKTLELPKIFHHTPVEEPELEEEEEEDEPEPEHHHVHIQPISYHSIGFRPAKVKPTKFITASYSHPEHVHEEKHSPCGVHAPPYCKDGYRSGQVIIKEAPVSTQVLIEKPAKISCHGDEGTHYNEPTYTYSESKKISSSGSTSGTYNSESTHYRKHGCNCKL